MPTEADFWRAIVDIEKDIVKTIIELDGIQGDIISADDALGDAKGQKRDAKDKLDRLVYEWYQAKDREYDTKNKV